jgi:hypothetical protein
MITPRWILAIFLTLLVLPVLVLIDAGLWCCGKDTWRALRSESRAGVRRIWRSRKP